MRVYCQKEIDGDFTVRRSNRTILIGDLEEKEARKIVHCWNAFEEGGSVDKLCKASKKLLSYFGVVCNYTRATLPEWDKAVERVKAAIAEARNDKAKEVSK